MKKLNLFLLQTFSLFTLKKVALFCLLFLQIVNSYGQSLGADIGAFNYNALVVKPHISNNQTVQYVDVYVSYKYHIPGNSNITHWNRYVNVDVSLDGGATHLDLLDHPWLSNISSSNFTMNSSIPITYIGLINTGPSGNVTESQYLHFRITNYDLNYHSIGLIKFSYSGGHRNSPSNNDHWSNPESGYINFSPNYGDWVSGSPLTITTTDNRIVFNVSNVGHIPLSTNCFTITRQWSLSNTESSGHLSPDQTGIASSFTHADIIYDDLGPNNTTHPASDYLQHRILESNYTYARKSVRQINNSTTLDVPLIQSVSVNNKTNSACNVAKLSFSPLSSSYIDAYEYKLYNSENIEVGSTTGSYIDVDISEYAPGETRTLYLKTKAKYLPSNVWHESVSSLAVDVTRLEAPTLPTSISLEYDALSDGVVVSWNNIAGDETVDEFDIFRGNTNINNGSIINNTSLVSSNSSIQSFIDSSPLENCSTHGYTIVTKSCERQTSSDVIAITINTGLSNTFTNEETSSGSSIKNLVVSKGYFADKVDLAWDNNNNSIIESFVIRRRLSSATSIPWTSLAQVDNSVHYYVDEYTESGKYYEYQITAKVPCGVETIAEEFSAVVIGYRVPVASVSGSINFAGANSVENVKVSVTSTATNTNKSLVFNGGGSYIDISSAASGFSSNSDANSFTFSTWIKSDTPTNTKQQRILRIDNQIIFFRVNNSLHVNAVGSSFSYDAGDELNSWAQVTISYDQSTSTTKLYVNGDLKESMIHPDKPQFSNTSTIRIVPYYEEWESWASGYEGSLDEIRLWNRALTAEDVTNSYDRYIATNDEGLIAMYHCDEGLGNHIYDQSKSNIGYNKNDGQFVGGISYSENCPSTEQISNYALTDENGNYIIEGIRYSESGGNYTVTPKTTTNYYATSHEFEPSQRVVYLGDGNATSDGQNFTDISAFRLTGSVYFHDLHDYDNDGDLEEKGNCPVKDVVIKIDGEPLILNGELVMTDAQGMFDINVPIGDHIVSVEKNGHTFSHGVYPSTSTHNFQEEISGIIFTDNTVVKVAGRAVGGIIEGDKKLGHHLSSNNIGIVNFDYISQNTKDTLAVATNSISGEYMVDLLPIPYSIVNFNCTNNGPVTVYTDFQDFEVLNLSFIPELTTVIDTVYASDAITIAAINTASYHFKQGFIYRATPSVSVLNDTKTADFTADNQILIDSVPFTDLASFSSPIFTQNRNYKSFIVAEEVYYNNDDTSNPIIDRVPISNGQFTITNNLSNQTTSNTILLDALDGAISYDFKAGVPNLLVDLINSSHSFTKTWEVKFETGPYTVFWEPNGMVYRGILFGAKAEGTNFITNGPQVVSRILRDPPGSASIAFYEQGSTVSEATTVSTNLGSSLGVSQEVSLGTKFSAGIGLTTETEVKLETENETSISTSIGHNGEYVESTTFTSGFSTNGDNEYQGMWMDIYMGRSMNMNFGVSTNLTLIDTSDCDLDIPAIECIGEPIGAYKIGTRKGFYAIPGGYGTEFYYTQYEIVNGLIPELKLLRNNYFVNDDRYVVSTPSSFTGENNIDTEQNNDSLKCVDNVGSSYNFTSSDGLVQVDSVVWYNQQIRLWEQAIANNEKLKLNASPVSQGAGNISFDGGVGDITYSYENTSSSSNSISWEAEISTEFESDIGGLVGGSGASFGMSFGVTINNSGDHTWSDESTTSVGFTLSDGDLDDKYSIDILDDGTSKNGKVFKVQGGRTSCPYFGGEQTLYHLPGTEFSAATIQMDQPSISVSPSALANVPEEELAVFNLSLGNNNPLDYDREYELKIIESSNPYGAIIKIDGLNPNRVFEVPAGTTFNKILTVEKGPEALDYQDIEISFQSVCENDISETVLFSVSFLPGCTDIDILNPDPNWIINSQDVENDTTVMNILVSDYNYNYYSLDNIAVQFKETNSSNWVILETFYKNTDSLINIPTGQSNISVPWDLSDLPDGDYDIRAITDCNLASEETSFYSGHVDRVRPHNFGNPSPADGVLDPNDELQLNFNENIKETDLGQDNFSISGILNGSEIRHDASLFFNGSDAMTIPTGINLQDKSFTIEMWVNAQSAGTLFSQGYDDGGQMSLALNSSNQLEFTVSGETVSSYTSLTSITAAWKHVSVIYNATTGQVDFLVNGDLQNSADGGLPLLADYKGEGPITVGTAFTGNIHELRVWRGLKSADALYVNMLKTQSGKESNLLGCWAMDELVGLPQDKSRSRHASTSATWQVIPGGAAYSFNASSQEYIEALSPAFREDQDFTIELWFKSSGSNQTILSNGAVTSLNASTLYGNYQGWTIQTNSVGKVEVQSNLQSLTSIGTYTDNNWHYLALVKKDNSTTSLYIDGIEQAVLSSDLFNGFGGPKLVLGALVETNSTANTYSKYLNGAIDEVRIWNKARTLSQLTRDAQAKLNGDENGLVSYYPFETYALNQFYVYESYTSLNDAHTNDLYAANDLSGTGSFETADIPLVRIARSIENVNYTYSSNGDKLIFTIDDDLTRVEGCILDIEVDLVKDLYGNQMSSPITWTAYINQNQLIWDEQLIQKEKILGESMTFEIDIINQGGSLEQFEISNLPIWLTANPSEGILDPSTHTSIEFVVNEDLFIGDYTEDIMLTGNNEYAERLELQVNVEALSPTYSLDPSNFEYTMNFMGKVSLDGIRSRDEKDILFAFVGDELRGATELIYIEDYDAYFVFFSVYSNNALNESIEFRLWDASEGKIQAQIMVNEASSISFEDEVVVGSFNELIHFEATNMLRQEIALNSGWNWVSFNLDAEDGASPNHLMIPTVTSSLTEINISNFKSQSAYAQYIDVEGMDQNWFGSLTELSVEDMFMLKISEKDTIVYEGQAVLPYETPISISSGWNWIGYLGQRMLAINDALSSLNPISGDVVKSKTAFSMYANESLGWLGSLNNMQGGKGYMLRSNNSGALIYPESSMYGGSQFRMDNNKYSHNLWKVDHSRYENSMSFVARIEHPDYEKPQTNNLLGVFSGLNCVGNITAIEINTEESLYFITVHGNDGDELRFDYLDVERDKVYRAENVVEFESDKLIGTIDNPYPININVEAQDLAVFFDLSIYPNPFSTVFDLSFTLDESVKVEIQLYDVMGRFVKTISKSLMNTGTHKLQIEGENLAKGVYFIEVIVGEDLYKKMIVKS